MHVCTYVWVELVPRARPPGVGVGTYVRSTSSCSIISSEPLFGPSWLAASRLAASACPERYGGLGSQARTMRPWWLAPEGPAALAATSSVHRVPQLATQALASEPQCVFTYLHVFVAPCLPCKAWRLALANALLRSMFMR